MTRVIRVSNPRKSSFERVREKGQACTKLVNPLTSPARCEYVLNLRPASYKCCANWAYSCSTEPYLAESREGGAPRDGLLASCLSLPTPLPGTLDHVNRAHLVARARRLMKEQGRVYNGVGGK